MIEFSLFKLALQFGLIIIILIAVSYILKYTVKDFSGEITKIGSVFLMVVSIVISEYLSILIINFVE